MSLPATSDMCLTARLTDVDTNVDSLWILFRGHVKRGFGLLVAVEA